MVEFLRVSLLSALLFDYSEQAHIAGSPERKARDGLYRGQHRSCEHLKQGRKIGGWYKNRPPHIFGLMTIDSDSRRPKSHSLRQLQAFCRQQAFSLHTAGDAFVT